MKANKRLLIVQYASDYRETFKQIRENGIETYHAQKYVIDSISHINYRLRALCCRRSTSQRRCSIW